jgi:hypothetical protein
VTTLTFDYRDSYRRIDHVEQDYSPYANAWTVTPLAWDGKAFHVKPITVQTLRKLTWKTDLSRLRRRRTS